MLGNRCSENVKYNLTERWGKVRGQYAGKVERFKIRSLEHGHELVVPVTMVASTCQLRISVRSDEPCGNVGPVRE